MLLSHPEFFYTFLHNDPAAHQRHIVKDAGFEPWTSAPEVWYASNEPPHHTWCFKIDGVTLIFKTYNNNNSDL